MSGKTGACIVAEGLCGWGGACVFTRLLGHVLLYRLLRRSRAVEFGLIQRVRVRVSEDCDRPISFGLLRRRFCCRHDLSRSIASSSSTFCCTNWRIFRSAMRWGIFCSTCCFPILYFHPLYWLLRRKTNLARELIADDLGGGAELARVVCGRLAGAGQGATLGMGRWRRRRWACFNPKPTFTGECTC
jgi:hypothetical protein